MKELQAALNMFGINALPKTEHDIMKLFRKKVKEVHPEQALYGRTSATGTEIKQVYQARAVLLGALKEQERPKLWVKFGFGDSMQAKVLENEKYKKVFCDDSPQNQCKYVTTLKWFYGLLISGDNCSWSAVECPKAFAYGDICVCFIK